MKPLSSVRGTDRTRIGKAGNSDNHSNPVTRNDKCFGSTPIDLFPQQTGESDRSCQQKGGTVLRFVTMFGCIGQSKKRGDDHRDEMKRSRPNG